MYEYSRCEFILLFYTHIFIFLPLVQLVSFFITIALNKIK